MVLFINYIIPTSLTLKCLLLFALRPKLMGTNRKRASRETPLILLRDFKSIWWKIQRKDIIQIPDRAPLGFRNPEDRRSIVVLILYRFEIFTVELQLR